MEKLRDYYSKEKPLKFFEFNGGFHSHFQALYSHSEPFGGNERGAIYVYPVRVSHGKLIVRLLGRGLWQKVNEFQVINLESVEFVDLQIGIHV